MKLSLFSKFKPWANEITTSGWASVINSEAILEARLAFQKDANLAPKCWVKDLTGIPTATASYTVFTAATVTKPASETTDVTTNSTANPADVTLTVARRTIKLVPSDLSIGSSQENMSARLGQIIGKARAKQVDTDILAVMTTNYTSSTGATNSTDVSIAMLLSALLTLEVNEANDNLSLVLHPKQWNHLRGDLVLISGTADSSDKSAAGQSTMATGFTQVPLLGAGVLVTPRVGTGTDTNDMYLGILGNFAEGIGYTVKNASAEVGVPEIELQRDASMGATEFVHNYYDKAGIVRAAALVLVKSQTY